MMAEWTTIGAQAKHKASDGRIKEGDNMVDVNNSRDITNTKTVERRIVELSESLGILMKLRESFPGTPTEWEKGTTLIKDDYFEEYIKDEFFEEYIKHTAAKEFILESWPMSCINWPEAASVLKKGYSQVIFEGVTYWVKKMPKENILQGA